MSDHDDEYDDDLDDDLDLDDDYEDEDEDEDEDDEGDEEFGGEGNRIVGARARAVVEHVTRHLVEDPDSVDVELQETSGGVMLLVHADPSDLGRLIGKRGRVIQALRQVVRAAGASEGIKANVDVVE